jgi:glycosyltransferase involved in cell wall biosynthesis
VGLPVVATKCGGPESFVCDLNGRLAEVNSVDSLAQQMTYIMQNKNSFDGKKIKEFVVSRYSPSNVADQLINTYTALLKDIGS